MNELCEVCRQPLCPWEGERCEVCLLNERTTDEEVKDSDRKKANGQTTQALHQCDHVRGQASAGGRGVDRCTLHDAAGRAGDDSGERGGGAVI